MNGAGKGKSCMAERRGLSGEDMDWEISSLWRGLMVVLYSEMGRILFDRYGATRWRNRDWRACIMFLIYFSRISPKNGLTSNKSV